MPVGKAYFGFTDEELVEIDRWVRNNTTDRFGPVRAVRAEPDHGLVLEVAFEGLSALDAASLRRRDALSAGRAPALGQAAARGRPHRDAGGAAAAGVIRVAARRRRAICGGISRAEVLPPRTPRTRQCHA